MSEILPTSSTLYRSETMESKDPEEHDERDHNKHDKRYNDLNDAGQRDNPVVQGLPSPQQDNDELSDQTQQIENIAYCSGSASSSSFQAPPDLSDDRDDIRRHAIATLDKDRAMSTWAMHKVLAMKKLLEQAGEDGSWIDKQTTRNQVAQFLVERRNKREAAGKVVARKVMKAPATTKEKTGKNVAKDENPGKAYGSSDARSVGRHVKAGMPRKDLDDMDVQPAKKLLKTSKSGKTSEPTELPRASKGTVEGYICAIREQYRLDLKNTEEDDLVDLDIKRKPGAAAFRRETQLLDADGNLILSSEIQTLVRQLTRLHDMVNPLDGDTILLADDVPWKLTRHEHTRVSGELAYALGNFIKEEGVDGFEVARGLVHQLFGLGKRDEVA